MDPLEIEMRLQRIENMMHLVVEYLDRLSGNVGVGEHWDKMAEDIRVQFPHSLVSTSD